MRCECPDRRFFTDLADLNFEFLALLVHPEARNGRDVLGLEPAWVEMLMRLTDSELRFIAGTPCLLAGFVAPPVGVGDSSGTAAGPDTGWREAVRMYSVALLSFLRTATRRDRLVATLCLGPGDEAPERFARIPLGSIPCRASAASDLLRARLVELPKFWPDLIRAARSDDTEMRELSRLRALPMIVAPKPVQYKMRS